ncbi:MAG: hypothetical protein R3185_01480 [Candidatus Thermoplasmatota archaeon]|nr:hypothetical protein [Candidatus Thermoplasmatota archaeon]
MAKLKVPPKLMRIGDAVFGGFTVGEKAWEGDRWKAAGLAIMLFGPLVWQKRLGALALAGAAALVSYYFAEELHHREAVTVPVEPPSGSSLN